MFPSSKYVKMFLYTCMLSFELFNDVFNFNSLRLEICCSKINKSNEAKKLLGKRINKILK